MAAIVPVRTPAPRNRVRVVPSLADALEHQLRLVHRHRDSSSPVSLTVKITLITFSYPLQNTYWEIL